MKQHLKDFQLYQLIDRKKFKALNAKWEMDKHVRTFKTWELTCVLVLCHLFRYQSYDVVETIL